MPSLLPPMRSTNLLAATAVTPLIKLDRRTEVLLRAHVPSDAVSPQPPRRSKIWELAETLALLDHRNLPVERGAAAAPDPAGGPGRRDGRRPRPACAGRAARRQIQKAGAKHLQKALDRRHQPSINQFAKAKDAASVAALWEEFARGDIPGAYWALLTHPAATDTMVKEVFGKVHMLSHLVGAANRADIRRLRQLEEDNAALGVSSSAQQQRQLRDGFTSRDETIRRLNDMLARQSSVEGSRADREGAQEDAASAGERDVQKRDRGPEQEARAGDRAAGAARAALERDVRRHEKDVGGIADGGRRAGRSAPRAGVARGSHRRAAAARDRRRRDGARALRSDDAVRRRTAQSDPAVESRWSNARARASCTTTAASSTARRCCPASSAGPIVLLFPIDCISHDAVATLKRLCRQLEKPYLPLRTASLATLASSLAGMARNRDA